MASISAYHDTSNQNNHSIPYAKLPLFTEWFQPENELKQNLKVPEQLYCLIIAKGKDNGVE